MPIAHANGIDIEYVIEGDPADPPCCWSWAWVASSSPGPRVSWTACASPRLPRHPLRQPRRAACRPSSKGCRTSRRCSPATRRQRPLPGRGHGGRRAALLTELGVARAHVVGVSMGGMITQALAINHPDRFLSACSIMSTTGDRSVGAPTGEAIAALLGRWPRAATQAIEASWRAAGSSAHRSTPTDEALLRRRAAAAYDRCYCPDGTARQLAAILASPIAPRGCTRCTALPGDPRGGRPAGHLERRPGHGRGRAGLEADPIPGMGHDLPEAPVGADHRRRSSPTRSWPRLSRS